MNIPFSSPQPTRAPAVRSRPSFDCVALLLQGGGALGAYQGGVYEALADANVHPDWVAGISIGAINAALIAGNTPQDRVAKLRLFWETITSSSKWQTLVWPRQFGGDIGNQAAVRCFSAQALLCGAPGLFQPRMLPPALQPAGTPGATSFYDTSMLKGTLERLVDFDRINSGEMRFSVGAVNVKTGNLVCFDNGTQEIRPEHIMASGALPPGFPAVEIEGELYWDGGIVSNTPLQWVLESDQRLNTLAFQVDLWSARGAVPTSLGEVITRQKDIQYSSRTRANSDAFRKVQQLRSALAKLLGNMPEELKSTPEFALLSPEADRKFYNLVQLIYRSKPYEQESKDFEFSRESMEDHWVAGRNDTIRTLRHPEVLERSTRPDGIYTFDIARDGRLS